MPPLGASPRCRRLFGNRPVQRSQSVSHKRASVHPEVRELLNSPINPEERSERPFPHLSHTLYVVCAQSATTSKRWEGRGRQGVVPPTPHPPPPGPAQTFSWFYWKMCLKRRKSPDGFKHRLLQIQEVTSHCSSHSWPQLDHLII